MVLDPSGRVAAVVVSVGGFLGIGEREVGIVFNALRMARDENGNTVIMLEANEDRLLNAPVWTSPKV